MISVVPSPSSAKPHSCTRTPPYAHFNLGVAIKQKSDLDGAIAEYRQALSLKRKSERARMALDEVLEKKAGH